MIIDKGAWRVDAFRRALAPFRAAREGFRAFIEASGFDREGTILLPAYIGWSAREGSGVFDPVRESGARWVLYPVREDLSIDLDALAALLAGDGPCLLVLIHYFGFPAVGGAAAARLARRRGAMILEDQAHSLLSDWVGGTTGRLGDASIYSFHKLFPTASGGGLSLSPRIPKDLWARLVAWPTCTPLPLDPLSYDLRAISGVRRRNMIRLTRLMAPLREVFWPLHPRLPRGVVPQSYPILVRRGSRDQLYEEANAAGFGVVSLYHTMIPEVRAEKYPASHRISSCILNLPVHQDVPSGGLEAMVAWLAEWAKRA